MQLHIYSLNAVCLNESSSSYLHCGWPSVVPGPFAAASKISAGTSITTFCFAGDALTTSFASIHMDGS